MSTSGLITMLVTEISVTVITCYFFFKVLFAKPKKEISTYKEEISTYEEDDMIDN